MALCHQGQSRDCICLINGPKSPSTHNVSGRVGKVRQRGVKSAMGERMRGIPLWGTVAQPF